MSKKYHLRMHLLLQEPQACITVTFWRQNPMSDNHTEDIATDLLHNIQEEEEQELISEGRVTPTPCSLALLYILTSLRSIPSSWMKAYHADKHSFLLQHSEKVRFPNSTLLTARLGFPGCMLFHHVAPSLARLKSLSSSLCQFSSRWNHPPAVIKSLLKLLSDKQKPS